MVTSMMALKCSIFYIFGLIFMMSLAYEDHFPEVSYWQSIELSMWWISFIKTRDKPLATLAFASWFLMYMKHVAMWGEVQGSNPYISSAFSMPPQPGRKICYGIFVSHEVTMLWLWCHIPLYFIRCFSLSCLGCPFYEERNLGILLSLILHNSVWILGIQMFLSILMNLLLPSH